MVRPHLLLPGYGSPGERRQSWADRHTPIPNDMSSG
jgi:hypothetical protein